MRPWRLYGRPCCGLCEEMEAVLRELGGPALQSIWRDVDREPEMQVMYGARIPVLLDGEGVVLAEGRLHAEDLPRLRELIGAVAG